MILFYKIFFKSLIIKKGAGAAVRYLGSSSVSGGINFGSDLGSGSTTLDFCAPIGICFYPVFGSGLVFL
jgi:hypothetical protein